MKPYIEKENANVKWVNGNQVLIVDRTSKYRNKLAKINSDL